MDMNLIAIPPIELHWTDWYVWERLTSDARIDPNSITPPSVSGVYEVRLNHQDERLAIGKAADDDPNTLMEPCCAKVVVT